MKPLCLVGAPAVGKSFIGAKLAAHLGGNFFDTDQEMERIEGRPIIDFLPEMGEDRFRAFESQVMVSTMKKVDLDPRSVVATGAGIVERDLNRLYLQRMSRPVCLFAPLPVLMKRMEGDHSRPLWKRPGGKELLRARLERRLPWYQEVSCNRIVSVYGGPILDEPASIVNKILNILGTET